MNAEATVLKLYPLGENGLIAVWCTDCLLYTSPSPRD